MYEVVLDYYKLIVAILDTEPFLAYFTHMRIDMRGCKVALLRGSTRSGRRNNRWRPHDIETTISGDVAYRVSCWIVRSRRFPTRDLQAIYPPQRESIRKKDSLGITLQLQSDCQQRG